MTAQAAPAVSLIVPVYNVEKYLPGCLESIREQTFRDFELILVDDGSTDGSAAICDQAAAEGDARVIHQSNGGLSAARNAGMKIARGRYITFVDSDDIVAPDYLKALVEGAERYDADIVSVRMRRFADDKVIRGKRETGLGKVAVYTGKEAARRTLYQKGDPDNSACGKLFRRSLWENLGFKEGILYEDLEVIYRVMLEARKVVTGSVRLYYYRRNSQSILGKFNKRRADVLDVVDGICSKVASEHPDLSGAARSRALSANFNMLLLFQKYLPEEKEVIARCKKNIKALRRGCLTDSDVRIKNKLGILWSYFMM